VDPVTALRPALPGDVEGIVAMMREFYLHERIELDEDRARRALADLVADPSLGGVPWVQMRGLRNFIVHSYHGVRITVVWETIEHDIPLIVAPLRAALEADGGRT
jgi:hypothetical protein